MVAHLLPLYRLRRRYPEKPLERYQERELDEYLEEVRRPLYDEAKRPRNLPKVAGRALQMNCDGGLAVAWVAGFVFGFAYLKRFGGPNFNRLRPFLI